MSKMYEIVTDISQLSNTVNSIMDRLGWTFAGLPQLAEHLEGSAALLRKAAEDCDKIATRVRALEADERLAEATEQQDTAKNPLSDRVLLRKAARACRKVAENWASQPLIDGPFGEAIHECAKVADAYDAR